MNTFTVRDLQDCADELIRSSEAGQPSIVTRNGQPVFLAVPFGTLVSGERVGLALALKLFQQADVSLGKAAGLAGVSRQEFLGELARRGIPVTDAI